MNVSTPITGIYRRHARNLGLYLLLHVSIRLMAVARIYLIAHALLPVHVGVASIVIGIVSLLASLTRPGISTALVQSQEDIRPFLDALWTLNLLRGLGVSVAVVAAGCGALALLGHMDALPYLLAISVTPAISGLSNQPGTVLAVRSRRLHRTAAVDSAQAGGELVALMLALLFFRDTWALVIAFIGNALAFTLASYLMHPYRPRPDLRLGRLRGFYTFGRWTQATTALETVISRLDVLLLVGMVGAYGVGLYSMSQSVAMMPRRHLMNLVREFLMPSLSRMRSRPGAARRLALGTLAAVTLFALLYVAVCVALARTIVAVFMGEGWMDAVPVFQVLALASGFRLFDRAFISIFEAAGCPSRGTLSGCIFGIALLGLMAALIPLHGLMGAAWAVMGASAVVFSVNLWMAVHVLRWPGPTPLQARSSPPPATGRTHQARDRR